MSDFLQLAFDDFHSEMDVVLGAPWAFSLAILAIAVIEYFIIWSLQRERLQTQNARIDFLAHKLARFESQPHESAAEAPAQKILFLEDIVPVSASSPNLRLGVRQESLEGPHLGVGSSISPQRPEAKVSTSGSYSEIVPRRLDKLAETRAPHIQEIDASESQPHPIAAELPSQDVGAEQNSSSAGASAPRLHLSILNLHEGSRVGVVVEVEVLATAAMEKLQAWVFSAQSRQWIPQQPFWRNRGVLISTCRFGDERTGSGDEFRVMIVESESPLSGPVSVFPRDLPRTKPLTVYRA